MFGVQSLKITNSVQQERDLEIAATFHPSDTDNPDWFVENTPLASLRLGDLATLR